MDIGSWFEYDVTIEETGKSDLSFHERYVLESSDTGVLVFRLFRDEEDRGTVEGDPDSINGIFDGCGLRKVGTEELDYSGMSVHTVVLRSDCCGGGESIWIGSDGIVYKNERMQMWSMGVIHRETHHLTLFSIR